MKSTNKLCLLVACTGFLQISAFSQSFQDLNHGIKGTVYTNLTFSSQLIHQDIRYSVYLPPGYHASQNPFPVYYLLHGLGGNENSWINDYSVHRVADSLISLDQVPPMIIVMPDGRRSYYINDYRDSLPYESVFNDEFVPFIDSHYKTIPSVKGRFIGGLSMGGYGALVHAMRYPDTYGTVIALSAAVRTDSMIIHEKTEKYVQVFQPLFGDSIKQYGHITRHWKDNNPLYLVPVKPDSLRTLNWYIDCGLTDYLLPGNEALHDLFVRYQISHTIINRTGGHERNYWTTGLVPSLLYIGRVNGE